MDLKKRLFSNLFPVGLAFLLLLGVASLLIISINNSAQNIVYESDPPIRVMEYFLLNVLNDNIVLASYLETKSYEETIEYDKRLYGSYQQDLELKRQIDNLIIAKNFSNQRIIDYYQEAKAVHDDVILKRNELITLHKESLISGSDVSIEKQKLLKEHKDQFESAKARLSQIIEQIALDNKQIQGELVSKIQFYSVILILLLAIFLVVLINRVLTFSNEIVNPLAMLMEKTRQFVKGDYRVRVTSNSKISEIKVLEKNINNVFRAVDETTSKQKAGKNGSLLKKEYHDLLAILKDHASLGKQTTISDLKSELNITHPTLLSRLKFLEMKGYIKIVKVGREKVVTLTTKGQ